MSHLTFLKITCKTVRVEEVISVYNHSTAVHVPNVTQSIVGHLGHIGGCQLGYRTIPRCIANLTVTGIWKIV